MNETNIYSFACISIFNHLLIAKIPLGHLIIIIIIIIENANGKLLKIKLLMRFETFFNPS